MNWKLVAYALAFLSFFGAFLILYQQYQSFGVWFQIEDVHHESLAMSVAALGIGLLAGASLASKGRK